MSTPKSNPESLILSRQMVLEPNPKSSWAHEMVLNPAIIQDPVSGRIHMLFRATGAYAEHQQPGQPAPYPIFLGYAWSDDAGHSWQVDFSRPALAPRLAVEPHQLYRTDADGAVTMRYDNGCIEDPRLFFLEGACYCIVACRLFPPGPYWIHDDPMQCAPRWAYEISGRAATENVTVNVLYRVDLAALGEQRYDAAFDYITHLTDPNKGENRDVILFPRKLRITGTDTYVCLHRPWESDQYAAIGHVVTPSIAICAATTFTQFATEEWSQQLLATPKFNWESGRIGASANVLEISPGEWLLSYHGKKDSVVGYTQSFMILKEQNSGLPIIAHRCSERVLYPVEHWEMPGRFKAPVIFITGMIALGEELLVSYGAADERVGVARLDLPRLISYLKEFDAEGRRSAG